MDKKQLNEVNQIIKKINNSYHYLGEGKFYAKNDGYEVIIHNHLYTDTELYTIHDTNELYSFLKASKEVKSATMYDVLLNENNDEFKSITFHNPIKHENHIKNLKRSYKYSFKVLDDMFKTENKHLILDMNSTLSYMGKTISDTLMINSVVDVLSDLVSKDSDHTLMFANLNNNTLNIVNEVNGLDNSEPFIILEKNLLHKFKLLKKDIPFTNIYLKDESEVLLHYGVSSKMEIFVSMNAVMCL